MGSPTEDNELLPLSTPPSSSSTATAATTTTASSSNSSVSRGAGALPLPTSPSSSSLFESIRKKAKDAIAASSPQSTSKRGFVLPTTTLSSTSPERNNNSSSSSSSNSVRRRRLVFFFFLGTITISSALLLAAISAARGEERAKKVEAIRLGAISRAAAQASSSLRAAAVGAAAATSSLVSSLSAQDEQKQHQKQEKQQQQEQQAQQPQIQRKQKQRQNQQQQQQQNHHHLQRRQQKFPISEAPLTAFVGVQSRPKTPRRQALRDTWFPSTSEERERLMRPLLPPPSSTSSSSSSSHNASSSSSSSPPPLHITARGGGHRGIVFRFVVGVSSDEAENAIVAEENALHDDILVLTNVRESYDNLVLKTVAFFSAAVEAFPRAEFIVKIDDDVYVRPDNLALVAQQWGDAKRDYVGCLMLGGAAFDDKKSSYYEPLGALLPSRKYYGYMSGSAYALSRRAAKLLRSRTRSGGAVVGEEEEEKERSLGDGDSGGGGGGEAKVARGPLGGLRPMACEDCAVGLWLLAHDVRHGEDLRMCRYDVESEREEEVEEVEVEEVAEGSEAEAGKAPTKKKTKRKRHSCGGGAQQQAPVVLTNRCNGLCDPINAIRDLHSDRGCRLPTLETLELEDGGGGGGGKGGGGGGGGAAAVAPAATATALPLGDFWSSGRMLSRADADALDCIRITEAGDVDKSACREDGG